MAGVNSAPYKPKPKPTGGRAPVVKNPNTPTVGGGKTPGTAGTPTGFTGGGNDPWDVPAGQGRSDRDSSGSATDWRAGKDIQPGTWQYGYGPHGLPMLPGPGGQLFEAPPHSFGGQEYQASGLTPHQYQEYLFELRRTGQLKNLGPLANSLGPNPSMDAISSLTQTLNAKNQAGNLAAMNNPNAAPATVAWLRAHPELTGLPVPSGSTPVNETPTPAPVTPAPTTTPVPTPTPTPTPVTQSPFSTPAPTFSGGSGPDSFPIRTNPSAGSPFAIPFHPPVEPPSTSPRPGSTPPFSIPAPNPTLTAPVMTSRPPATTGPDAYYSSPFGAQAPASTRPASPFSAPTLASATPAPPSPASALTTTAARPATPPQPSVGASSLGAAMPSSAMGSLGASPYRTPRPPVNFGASPMAAPMTSGEGNPPSYATKNPFGVVTPKPAVRSPFQLSGNGM